MRGSSGRDVWRMLLTLALACLLVLVPTQAYAAFTEKVSVSVTQDYKSAQYVLKLINQRRKKAGLAAVKLDTALTKSAMQRAAEVGIYVPQGSPHRRPNGALVRTLNGKINYEICAEATGYATNAEIVKGWMQSPPHKKGILLKSARSVGIACVKAGPSYYIWVCEFSSSKAAKVLTSTKQGVAYNKTVVAKSGYLAKKYFTLGAFDSEGGGSYTDLWVGYPETLKVVFEGRYTYGPATLNPKSFTWKSSDPSVASISANGVVTPKKAGKVTITAVRKNKTSVKLTRTFTVYE